MHHMAWQAFFQRHGVTFTDDNFYKYMCGPPNTAILRQFIADLNDDEGDALSEEKEASTGDHTGRPGAPDSSPPARRPCWMIWPRASPYAIATGCDPSNVEFYM